MRELIRSVAKGRLAAMGVGNVNKKLKRKKGNRPLWRVVTQGESGKEAERIQLNRGELLKAQKQGKKVRAKRKVRKVTA